MADTKSHVVVQFLQSHKSYNSGERASFPPAQAQHLIDHGVAKVAGKGSLFKRAKKPAEQKLEPGSKVRFFIPKEGDATGLVVKAHPRGKVTVLYGEAELDLDRSELTFVAPPEPKVETQTEMPADPNADPNAGGGDGGDGDSDGDGGGDEADAGAGKAND